MSKAPEQLFVTGIGTDVGKSVVSAILAQKLEGEYWKPVQAGNLEDSDSHQMARWVSHPHFRVHPEAFRLSRPMSPHAAAELDGVHIELDQIRLPQTSHPLVVEGAGGLMVPLNHDKLMIDLIAQLNLPVVLVSKNYLGSINHTLLSLELLKHRRISVYGMVFNGPENSATEQFIMEYSKVRCLGRVMQEASIDASIIRRYAESWTWSPEEPSSDFC
ncbi:MAG: dethiobiotin synthase [SAR324 cluster bacterium]|nr:dethiobiotin synthase [SAR324 cluster bacterium]